MWDLAQPAAAFGGAFEPGEARRNLESNEHARGGLSVGTSVLACFEERRGRRGPDPEGAAVNEKT